MMLNQLTYGKYQLKIFTNSKMLFGKLDLNSETCQYGNGDKDHDDCSLFRNKKGSMTSPIVITVQTRG